MIDRKCATRRNKNRLQTQRPGQTDGRMDSTKCIISPASRLIKILYYDMLSRLHQMKYAQGIPVTPDQAIYGKLSFFEQMSTQFAI